MSVTRKLIVGCGYLGQRVAAVWEAAGQTVHAVTRSVERADVWRRRGWEATVADVCDSDTLGALPDSDTVLYAVGFDRSAGRTQVEVAVEGLRAVLGRLRGRCRRFLYISSSSVYGQQDGEWVDETSPCAPTQPGGRCCLAAEELVRRAFARDGDGGAAVMLRLAGIYGPGRLLTRVAGLQAGEALAGSPDAWLNLIHVDDAVQAVCAAEARGAAGACYLVCDDEPVTRGAYYRRLAELVGAPPPQFDASRTSPRGSGGLNKRCSNRQLRAALQVALRYPTYREGLPAALEERGGPRE